MRDPATMDAVQLNADYVESKFLPYAGMRMNP